MREISTLLGFELIRLCKAHRQRTEAALARLGLHVGQELLLLQLWQEDGLSQSQLAEAMEVDISTIGKAVQRMERAGLLSRSPDAQDARISRVYLTERGRALHESVVHVWHASEARLVEGLTEVEQVLLRRLLRQMITSLS
jgi:MarR family transcriptional regulator, organic hydroperoxide resistance regulator